MKKKEVKEISEGLKHLNVSEGENVVNYADFGDKWYCLLKGQVQIWLPKLTREIH